MPRKSGIAEDLIDALIEDVAKASIIIEKQHNQLSKGDDYPYTELESGLENARTVLKDDALLALGVELQEERVAGLPQPVVVKNKIMSGLSESQTSLDDLFRQLDRTPDAVTKATAVKILKNVHNSLGKLLRLVRQAILDQDEAKNAWKGKKRKKAGTGSSQFKTTVTYEKWTDADLATGEPSERGVVTEYTSSTLEEALNDLPDEDWGYWQGPSSSGNILVVSRPDESSRESLEEGVRTRYSVQLHKEDAHYSANEIAFIKGKLNLTVSPRPLMASVRHPKYIKVGGSVYKLAAGNFDVLVAYEKWTDEDKEIGETDDKGISSEYTTVSLAEALGDLPSVPWTHWGEAVPNGATVSFISQPEEDRDYFEKGIKTTYNAFIRKIDQSPFTEEELEFIDDKLSLLGERPVMAKTAATHPKYISVKGNLYRLAAPPESYMYHKMKGNKWDAKEYAALGEVHTLLEKWDSLSSAGQQGEHAFSEEVALLENEIDDRVTGLIGNLDWPPMLDELLEAYNYEEESAQTPDSLHTPTHTRSLQEMTAAKKKPGDKKLPKGWTKKSAKKFWKDLPNGKDDTPKKKVTKCVREIKKAKDKEIDDPKAFCSSLADMNEGPGWRKESAKKKPAKKKPTKKKKPAKKALPKKKKAMALHFAGYNYKEVNTK